MTDIRRTVLWVVFSASLFLIWNAWNVHNGQPSFFNPGAHPSTVAAPAPAASSSDEPRAGRSRRGRAGCRCTPAASAPPIADEQVTVTTDLVKATFDTRGGEIDRLELLKHVDQFERSRNEVLFDQTPERLYVAQTGLVPAAGGSGLPNHHTVMRLVPGPRTLAPGADTLSLTFESPEVGGVKLVKTYTFHRDSYAIDVKHEVVNESTRQHRAAPLLPARARRQCAARRLELLLHLHRPGRLHRRQQVQEGRLQEHREARAGREARPTRRPRTTAGSPSSSTTSPRPG